MNQTDSRNSEFHLPPEEFPYVREEDRPLLEEDFLPREEPAPEETAPGPEFTEPGSFPVSSVTKTKRFFRNIMFYAAASMMVIMTLGPFKTMLHGQGSLPPHVDPTPGPEPWPGPTPGPEPVPVIEYSILGQWSDGQQWYEFFEDGTGYWTNGKIFVLLYWEKSGNDYRYHGQGTTFYDNTSLMWSNIDAFTVYQDEKLLLQDHIGKDAYGTKEFTPSSVAFDLTNIKPLYHRSFKETIVGEWEHEWHMFREDEGYYVCMSYMVFSEDGTVNLLIASTMSADWAEYTLPYTFEEHGSEVLAKIGDGTKMYIKIQTENALNGIQRQKRQSGNNVGNDIVI